MKEKVIINVPVCWNDVSVYKFQELRTLKVEDYKSELSYSSEVMSVLCGFDAKNIDSETFSIISKELSFLSSPVSNDVIESVIIGKDTYKWIGSFNQITVGEMISIEQIIDLEELNYTQGYDVIAAVLLRKVKDNGQLSDFNANTFNESREMFSNLPIDQLNGMVNFFIAGGKICTELSVDYLVRLMSIPTSTRTKKSLLMRLYSSKRILNLLLNGLHWLINFRVKMSLKITKYMK